MSHTGFAAFSDSERAADPLLPRPPGALRRFWARHPYALDGILAGGFLVFALAFLFISLVDWWGSDPVLVLTKILRAVLVTVALTCAILFRRKYPLWGMGVLFVALIFPVLGPELTDIFAGAILVWSLPIYSSLRTAWIGYGAFSVAIFLANLGRGVIREGVQNGSTEGFTQMLVEVVQSSLIVCGMFLIIFLVGVNMGNRRRYLIALLDRAEQLARERDQRALLAASAERARIAREMHDIVAHSLSVMIALADGAAASTTRNPGAAQKAMLSSAETGRGALAEMRRLLGVLSVSQEESQESVERVPQPGVKNILTLVDSYRDAGLNVHYRVEGEPAIDQGQQLTVYRVVQESLTNSLRYAGVGASVDVSLWFYPGETRVVVVDDGTGTPGVRTSGSGRGLVGLRQRVEIFGGEVSAAKFGSGWKVEVTIPFASKPFDTEEMQRGLA
ncbi:histidine kinase [Lysinibacter sp. HNR]|uniref:sensor histidine kinase n=1 Tax=Lysinibacter sp. HNR TaxID=3031408 RepID=UPI0024354530|nr:histidine kinase [Lysinibacter sp. HNR]WGD37839.1 histidine kinase [Lysinibacter sp. HNR]